MPNESTAACSYIRQLRQHLKDREKLEELRPFLDKEYRGHWVAIYYGEIQIESRNREPIEKYYAVHGFWPVIVFIH